MLRDQWGSAVKPRFPKGGRGDEVGVIGWCFQKTLEKVPTQPGPFGPFLQLSSFCLEHGCNS